MTAEVPAGFRPLLLPASGFLNNTGPFLAKWDGATFILGLRIEDKHCNAAGVCHGGMVASVADVLLTVGSNIQGGQSRFLPTVSMTCDFLAPAPRGSWLEGRLEILRVTRNLLFASGLLEVPGEGLVARASAVMKVPAEADPRFSVANYFELCGPEVH